MNKKVLSGSIIFALLLSLNNAFASDIAWEAGAKRGWIMKVYDPKTTVKELPECVEKLPVVERENKHFAKIHYQHVKRGQTTIAEIPEGMQLNIDDEVEVFPGNCDAGKFARVVKVLSAKH
ncbi:hypothetical protein ACO0K3_02815 [Undibacterium sp. Rencai35W]|uniref:hypothetical protein n=1 Tax=Undibacterium sp. Rencai35W TaxID=3413046 RepID=UPI003BF276E2